MTLDEIKASLSLSGVAYADQDILSSLAATEQAIDDMCHRTFSKGEDANEERRFTPNTRKVVWVDDLEAITAVETDTSDDGSYATTLVEGTDFIVEPLNAVALSEPYWVLRAKLTPWVVRPAYVRVTGRFGWPTVPHPVAEAARILTIKLVKRKREAPFGIVTMGADAGVLMRLAQTDPDVTPLLRDYIKPTPVY